METGLEEEENENKDEKSHQFPALIYRRKQPAKFQKYVIIVHYGISE